MSGKFNAGQDNKKVFGDIQRNLRDGDSRKLLEAAGTASQQARQTPDAVRFPKLFLFGLASIPKKKKEKAFESEPPSEKKEMEEPSSPPNHHATASSPVVNGTSPSPTSSVVEILEPPSHFSSDSSEVGSPRPESPTLPPHQQLASPREERSPEAMAREIQEADGRMMEGDANGSSVPEEVRPQPTITVTAATEAETETERGMEYVGYYVLDPAATETETETETERGKEYVGYYVLDPATMTANNISKQEREMVGCGEEMAGFSREGEPAVYGSGLEDGMPTSRYLLERGMNQSAEGPRMGQENKGDDEGKEEIGKGKGKENEKENEK
ncbi:MAG: hypothetical protein Q9214_000848 [Letrouitia sp. 1 TL-2023]